jgi:hypothetical protein
MDVTIKRAADTRQDGAAPGSAVHAGIAASNGGFPPADHMFVR